MQTLNWNALDPAARRAALRRPAQTIAADIDAAVAAIFAEVEAAGDAALRALTAKYDRVQRDDLRISAAEIDAAAARVPAELKQALATAKANIETFHRAQLPPPMLEIETQPGVRCALLNRPLERIGLYIPGGSAPLFSTVLMLAIPARLAGCRDIILCTPPPVADATLYAARLCGVEHLYAVGGAQAIAALTLGTESIAPVDKIYGPGNAYVTAAKRRARALGTAIDMEAGPSEVLVIADDTANPDYIASDLLSQAEHGADSQVILVSPSAELIARTDAALARQLARLPRRDTAAAALAHSRAILAADLQQAVAISNAYAPEHLIVQTADPRALLPAIENAGSIFLGAYSPESMGDYASGTNHVLPTYGHSRSSSSLGIADFMKRMTVQELSDGGFRALAPAVMTLAAAEQLDAHREAVRIRLETTGDQP